MGIPSPRYLDAEAFAGDRLDTGAPLLTVVGFGAPRPVGLDPACPFVSVNLPHLVPGPAYEAWVGAAPASWGVAGDVHYATCDGALVGVISASGDHDDLEEFAFGAYQQLFAAADRAGCPHVLRVFNYLPRITDKLEGKERYWGFNAGRHAAFACSDRAVTAAPAACALGTRDGAPAIYFIAAAQAGRPVENPRQISPYYYPQRYGPRSPSFSRAMLCGDPARLFISGTASIVGHETLHIGDAAAQTEETLRNIDALLREAGMGTLADLAPALRLKIYVRHAEDVETIRQGLAALPPRAGEMMLQADICRRDLLMEIEAVYTDPRME